VSSSSVSSILSEKMETLRSQRESDDDVEAGLADQLMEESACFGREKEQGVY